MSQLILNNNSADVSTPAAGKQALFTKTDFCTYIIDEAARIGVNVQEHFIFTPAANYTLVSQTAAQKIFASPTNGALTVPAATSYRFHAFVDMTTLSATSGGFGFAIGGTATMTTIKWWSSANKAALATTASAQNTVNINAANTAICTATTNTVGWMELNGIMRVNAAGTIIPQVSQATASAAVVVAGSFFRCWPVGTNTVASIGPWT